MKYKHYARNSFRPFLLFLLLMSVFFTFGLVRVANGSVDISYYASEYNVLNGTYVSGSVPPSVASVDADYFIVRSAGTDTSVNTYNPSGYTLLNSTSWASGSISNLTSNDGVHMVFSGYLSGPDIEDYVDNYTSDVDSSIDRGTHSNFTAQQYGPDLINDTLTEENTGSSDTLWLSANAYDGNKTDWMNVGTSPYLDAIDYNANYTYASGNNLLVGDFNFTNSGKSIETISSVEVQLYAQQSGTNNNLEVFVWDGSSWTSLGTQITPTSWGWMNWTATTVLDTWAKIDGAKTYIQSKSGAGTYEVDCARLEVDYTATANYELDLEVQWTNVDYDETSEELCLYGGTMGAENIRVDVWNGSDWENLHADLNSGWNNVSVASYLDSSTFTIRFKGDTETGDTTQNTWEIDVALLHVWTEQYTAEVEFSGSSNIYEWKQLNWTFDSAWTIGSANVAIQLYNYTLGDYSTSGNGFTAYTSSATADTDETKTLTITTNPQHFRDVLGNWKIKIKGVKNTTTQFDLKTDWIELEPIHWSEYMVSAEFFYSTMTTSTPTQLNFTIVSQYNIAGVNVTIQAWNYSNSAYATSGEAYINYISSGTNETKTLSINANPQSCTSSGNATIKVTGMLSTITQYQQEVNQVKLIYSYPNSAPVLDPIGNKAVDELSLLNFTASASDPDSPPQNLTFSLGPGAPSGAFITSDGDFTWTPTEDQGPANHTIRIIVSDGSLTDYEDTLVEVYEVYIHDVAVVNVTTSTNDVVSGQVVGVTVIVENQGTATETFNVTIFYNATIIETKTVTNLAPGNQTTLEFMWNTTGLAEASYRIQAEASLVSGETETNNNVYTGAIVEVSTHPSQPFDWFRALLYLLPVLFGFLLLVGIKLERKKKTVPPTRMKTDKFSKQFGITHQQMKGKKMLFEIDPASDYHKDLLSFASEAKNNDELLFILTNKNSTLHLRARIAFSGDSDAKFLLLTSKTSSPVQMNESETLLPATDLSVLLDSLGSIQKVETKKTINVLFDSLSDVIVRCGFKKTQKFMHLVLEAISSSKVTVLFVFNPTAHDNKISSSIRDTFQKEVARARTKTSL